MSENPQTTDPAAAAELAQPAIAVAAGTLRWQEHTPARLWTGRAGVSYRTGTALELRRDHAAAVDAVHAELDLTRDLGAGFVRQFGLFEVSTEATSKTEYLARPDLGRRLNTEAKESLWKRCPRGAELQVVIGDGLSATAIAAQVPTLLPLLLDTATDRGWQIGQPFVVRHCRVGVLNDIGEQLDPQIIVLLIGERPGLATAESLSAYLAYRPRPGDTDARRNLISNIHAAGVPNAEAVERILSLADQLRTQQCSGVEVKEIWSRAIV
ncbi:MAG: ethanolamine ammonia-lyase subunit EutC [Planctomycetaceae bacterium]|nr:ethanolamine ammonia-lyase subunit EutC [Planctomycetaceae bacterium]